MKIATIIGARPQFIKAATVSRAIAAHNRNGALPAVEEILIHTGQHYDDGMSAIFFRELDIPEPKYNLEIGSGPHGRQTGRMLAAIEEVLLAEKPDWVLIYGDTNSTLAGALVAAKLHIPIAHVEAGLRSFNRRMPEEINRVVADQLSTLLLCPSQTAVDNLAAEGIGENDKKIGAVPIFSRKVVITGDVMADALQFAAAKVGTKAAPQTTAAVAGPAAQTTAHSDVLARLALQPQRYLLATVHRAENTDDPQRLSDILSAFAALDEPVVFPAHPRTRKFLHEKNYQPPPHVCLIDPVGYFDIVALEKSARLLLTDSGGMQKEAYWLKVPCITLRDETEWVETVDAGWNVLTGADDKKIIHAALNFTPPQEHPPLYGDGQTAEKILGIICQKA